MTSKTQIEYIAKILKENNITDEDLKDMIKKLPNGTWDIWDILEAYGIRYDTPVENS